MMIWAQWNGTGSVSLVYLCTTRQKGRQTKPTTANSWKAGVGLLGSVKTGILKFQKMYKKYGVHHFPFHCISIYILLYVPWQERKEVSYSWWGGKESYCTCSRSIPLTTPHSLLIQRQLVLHADKGTTPPALRIQGSSQVSG
jgi:hypothetical protein